MSAPRWLVLGCTAVVASPLAALLAEGHLEPDAALLRLTVCLAATWVALTLVWTFLLPAPGSTGGGPTAPVPVAVTAPVTAAVTAAGASAAPVPAPAGSAGTT